MRHLLASAAILTLVPALDAQCEIQALSGRNSLYKDFFGKSCDMEGPVIVVGAFAATTGRPGFAHVFELGVDGWTQTAKLMPSDGGSGDQFGNSVGVSGTTLVVGSEFHNGGAGSNSGAIYVFDRIGGKWQETAKLVPADTRKSLNFGEYVAIEGDVIVAGARFDATNGNNTGAAYVFERIGGVWTETAKLVGSAGARNDLSADTLAIQGGRILMSSYRSDASGPHSGSAYIFEKVGGVWTETAHLVANDGAGELSRGVAIDGDRVVLGARLESTAGGAAGAGYVFERQPDGTWPQTAKLIPNQAAALDWIGEAVAVKGDRIVLSGHHHDVVGSNSGAAFYFELDNGTWVQRKMIQSSAASPNDEFSFALAMDGDFLVGTSPFEGGLRGGAYVFTFQEDLCGCNGTEIAGAAAYGEGLGGANVGKLEALSMPMPDTSMVFEISGIPNGTRGTLYVNSKQIQRNAFGGTLLVPLGLSPIKIPFVLNGGQTKIAWKVPASLCGAQLYAQAAARDDTQVEGRAFTNGLDLKVGN